MFCGYFFSMNLFVCYSPQPNIEWIKETVDLLDSEITQMHQNSEHGPLLLSWMLLNFQAVDLSDENENFRKYRQFGARAVRLGVFGYLRAIICHPMFQDESVIATLVRTSIYEQLSCLCNLFDADGAIGQHPNVYDLLSELLTTPSLAKEFSTNEGKTC